MSRRMKPVLFTDPKAPAWTGGGSDASVSVSSRGFSSCCSPATGHSPVLGDSSGPAADVTACSVTLTSSCSLETKPCVAAGEAEEAEEAEEVETAVAGGGAGAVAKVPFRGASLSGVAPGGREPAGLAEVWVSDGAAEFVVPGSGATEGAGTGVVGAGTAAGGTRLGPGASAAVGVGDGAGMC